MLNPRLWATYWPALIVMAVSVVYQYGQGTTTDVSWLVTLSERLLDGQTAYVDFFEVNPPASILLYVPAVASARFLHLPPEATVKAAVYLSFVVDLLVCRSILRNFEPARPFDRARSLASLAAVFLLLPGEVFAQREHFLALFLLPILCVFTVRAEASRPPPMAAAVAGIEAGVAVCVKPFFIVAIALPLAYVLWRRRASRPAAASAALAPEVVALALVTAFYLGVVFGLFPAFATAALPIAVDVYGLYTNSHLAFLHSTNALLWASALMVAIGSAPRAGPPGATIVLSLGSLGCLAAMMLQARYFDYHAYPSVALALATAALALCRLRHETAASRREPRLPPAWGATLTAAIFASAMVSYTASAPDDRLRTALSRFAAHPRIMAISMGHGLAHPLVRRIGGTFVGRLNSPWMYYLIKRAMRDPTMSPEQRHRLQGYVDLEKRVVAEDIARERPDLVLVSREFDSEKTPGWPFIDENWIKSTPSLVSAFSAYAPVETVGSVTIWSRRTPAGVETQTR